MADDDQITPVAPGDYIRNPPPVAKPADVVPGAQAKAEALTAARLADRQARRDAAATEASNLAARSLYRTMNPGAKGPRK